MRKMLLGFGLVLIVSGGFYLRLHRAKPPIDTAYAGDRQVTIWSTTAQVREPVATVNFGDRLDVLDRVDEEVQVRTSNGVTGWTSQRDLISADSMQRSKDLDAAAAQSPVEATGSLKALTNVHLDPGRDSPRIRQLSKDTHVDLFKREAVEIPAAQKAGTVDTSASATSSSQTISDRHESKDARAESSGESNAEASDDVRKEDWWFVRGHLPDHSMTAGWILGRFIDLDVPEPLPDYASSAGMRIVAWFELNHVADPAAGSKPQYLVLGAHASEGQACDFSLMRVYTWSQQKERYETAFVDSSVCGKLPVKVGQQSSAPGADATFSFEDLTGGSTPEKTYRMHQTMVRLVRPGRAGNSAPTSKKHPK
jgi:hypothetical protein